jgi:hypothetical protein
VPVLELVVDAPPLPPGFPDVHIANAACSAIHPVWVNVVPKQVPLVASHFEKLSYWFEHPRDWASSIRAAFWSKHEVKHELPAEPVPVVTLELSPEVEHWHLQIAVGPGSVAKTPVLHATTAMPPATSAALHFRFTDRIMNPSFVDACSWVV